VEVFGRDAGSGNKLFEILETTALILFAGMQI